jgi:hypothetical protein
MESADSGNSTGVGLLVATGGVGCELSHRQITTTAIQTTADLKRFMPSPVGVKNG